MLKNYVHLILIILCLEFPVDILQILFNKLKLFASFLVCNWKKLVSLFHEGREQILDCNLYWSQKFCLSLASSVQTFQSNILFYWRVNFVYHHLTFPFSKFLKLSVYCKFSIGKDITLSNYTKIRVKKIGTRQEILHFQNKLLYLRNNFSDKSSINIICFVRRWIFPRLDKRLIKNFNMNFYDF